MEPQPNPCDAFEIASLQRAQGALDPEGVASLDAHLAACASCGAFAVAAVETLATLRVVAERAGSGRDFATTQAAFRKRLSYDRRRLINGIAILTIMLSLLIWSNTVFGLAAAGATALALVILTFTSIRPRRRRLMRAAESPADLINVYRGDLDVEIKQLRDGKPLVFLLTVLSVLAAGLTVANIMKHRALGDDGPDVRGSVTTFVMMAFNCVPLVYRTRFVLPRLERERRDLG